MCFPFLGKFLITNYRINLKKFLDRIFISDAYKYYNEPIGQLLLFGKIQLGYFYVSELSS